MRRQTIQMLSKQEIDERIGHVMSEVATFAGCSAEGDGSDATPCRPVWIAPGELVERMRRFLVYN